MEHKDGEDTCGRRFLQVARANHPVEAYVTRQPRSPQPPPPLIRYVTRRNIHYTGDVSYDYACARTCGRSDLIRCGSMREIVRGVRQWSTSSPAAAAAANASQVNNLSQSFVLTPSTPSTYFRADIFHDKKYSFFKPFLFLDLLGIAVKYTILKGKSQA